MNIYGCVFSLILIPPKKKGMLSFILLAVSLVALGPKKDPLKFTRILSDAYPTKKKRTYAYSLGSRTTGCSRPPNPWFLKLMCVCVHLVVE